MSSNFISIVGKKDISRQMNRSQKLKRKNTCKRYTQSHYSHPGLKNDAEAKTNCFSATKRTN